MGYADEPPAKVPRISIIVESLFGVPWFQRRFMEGARSEARERENPLW